MVYGGLKAVSLDGHPDAAKLVSIDQWGDISWTAMRSAFEGAANMVCKATDVPDLSRVTDTYQMFLGAASFNGDISSRDVSSVTAMSRMFYATSSFNRNLDGWYVQMGDTPVAGTTVPGAVGNVTAQNAFLDGQSPTYDMGAGGDSDRLAIPNGTILVLAETP